MPIKMKECLLINLSSHFSHLFQRGISSGIVWKLAGDPFYISQVRFLLSFVLKIQSPWISNLISFLSVLAWCTKKEVFSLAPDWLRLWALQSEDRWHPYIFNHSVYWTHYYCWTNEQMNGMYHSTWWCWFP